MGCQKVSADICGKKKNLFCLPTVSKGSLGRMVVFFFISCEKKMLQILHIFVCTSVCGVCVCVCKFSFFFFLIFGWQQQILMTSF